MRSREPRRVHKTRGCKNEGQKLKKIELIYSVLFFLVLNGSFTLVSAADGPLYIKNQSAVSGMLGIPAQREARSSAEGTYAIVLHSNLSNDFVSKSRQEEELIFDGEMHNLIVDLRVGLGSKWDIQIALPWVRYSGGFMDSTIDNWHDLWGFPNGGRELLPQDQVTYRYTGQNGSFNFSKGNSGFGDLSFVLSRALYEDDRKALSLGLGYKAAIGRKNTLIGSRNDDIFVVLRAQHSGSWPIKLFGQFGYLSAGNIALLGRSQEQDIWFGGVSASWAVTQSVAFIAQMDAHSAPAKSAMAPLGSTAILGSLGARWRFARCWSAEIGFIEDLNVGSAPDISFLATLRYH